MHFAQKIPDTTTAMQVVNLCRQIQPKFPKVWAWVQGWVNKNGHPEAIIDSLEGYRRLCGIDGSAIKSPWAYCQKIMLTKNGNYHEREFFEREKNKCQVDDVNCQIRELIKNMF